MRIKSAITGFLLAVAAMVLSVAFGSAAYAVEDGDVTYYEVIVKKGDWMYKLAKKFKVKAEGKDGFIEINRDRLRVRNNPNLIYPGEAFRLPESFSPDKLSRSDWKKMNHILISVTVSKKTETVAKGGEAQKNETPTVAAPVKQVMANVEPSDKEKDKAVDKTEAPVIPAVEKTSSPEKSATNSVQVGTINFYFVSLNMQHPYYGHMAHGHHGEMRAPPLAPPLAKPEDAVMGNASTAKKEMSKPSSESAPALPIPAVKPPPNEEAPKAGIQSSVVPVAPSDKGQVSDDAKAHPILATINDGLDRFFKLFFPNSEKKDEAAMPTKSENAAAADKLPAKTPQVTLELLRLRANYVEAQPLSRQPTNYVEAPQVSALPPPASVSQAAPPEDRDRFAKFIDRFMDWINGIPIDDKKCEVADKK